MCESRCLIGSEFVCRRLCVLVFVCVCVFGWVISNVGVYVIERLIEYVEFGIFHCL